MRPRPCRRFELEMVDEILGHLPQNKAGDLQHHLTGCSACRNLYREWQAILKGSKEVEPSSHLYRRIKNTFRLRQTRRVYLRPSIFWGAASAIVIGMLALGLTSLVAKKSRAPWEQLPLAPEEIPSFIVDDAKTIQYFIDPQEGLLGGINGIIWINTPRDEIYCYMQGLQVSDAHDYQLWLIKPVARESGGLLRLVDEYGRLHLQRRNVREILQISISPEPKGGSLFPTTEETILVDLTSPD